VQRRVSLSQSESNNMSDVSAAPLSRAQRFRWLGLIFISMGISLVIIDGTIVNTIFPQVIKALKLDSTQVQWVQESYVLVFTSLLLVWGSVADRFGRKLLLIVGIVIFTGASMWAGLSTDFSSMVLARVVQGIGGSMVLPTTLSLVNANFQGKERGIAFAIWGSTIGGMVALGPVLGGWLATDFGTDGWRLAFNINLPIGVIIMLFFVAESKVASAAKGIDFVGALLSVVMFSTLVFGLIEGRTYGWFTVNADHPFTIFGFNWAGEGISVIPVALLIALVSGTVFVLVERARAKKGSQVLLDLNLFKIASFRNGSIAALIISLGEFGILFALPLWFQNVQHLSPVESGLVLLWLAGGAFLASGVGGALSSKIAPAVAVRLGVLLELVGVIGTAFAVGADAGWGWVAPCLLFYGVGVGFATAQLTGVIMVDVPVELSGQGSGSQSTVRQIGSALGIAVLGTVLFTATQLSLETKLDNLNVTGASKTAIVNAVVDSSGGVLSDPTILPGILAGTGGNPADGQAVITAGDEAFSDGARWAALAASLFLAGGLASTFNLGSRKHGEEADA
jgi:EmrB/QacA subfamily drug resistance transporter